MKSSWGRCWRPCAGTSPRGPGRPGLRAASSSGWSFPEGVDSLEMFRRAREKGISIAPGPIFSNSGKYRNFLRLNAAHFSPKVERALETLGGLALEQVS